MPDCRGSALDSVPSVRGESCGGSRWTQRSRHMTAPRVAVPSRGRLRSDTLELLEHAGYATSMLHGGGSVARVDGLSFIEMRSRDAAAALAAGQVAAAFIATDLVVEHELEHLPALPLGFARS